MRCERAQELFSDYYEGSIQTALTVPLEDHLRTCGHCRDEFDGLQAVWPVLDSAPVVEPPADFRAIVWQRIDAAEAAEASRRKPVFRFDWQSLFPKPALGWAAAVLAVIVLAPFAVRGNFTPAGLGTPPIIRSPIASAAPVIGAPQVAEESGQQVLKVRILNSGQAPVRVDFGASNGSVAVNQPSIVVPARSNDWYAVGTLKPGASIPAQLDTSWSPLR